MTTAADFVLPIHPDYATTALVARQTASEYKNHGKDVETYRREADQMYYAAIAAGSPQQHEASGDLICAYVVYLYWQDDCDGTRCALPPLTFGVDTCQSIAINLVDTLIAKVAGDSTYTPRRLADMLDAALRRASETAALGSILQCVLQNPVNAATIAGLAWGMARRYHTAHLAGPAAP